MLGSAMVNKCCINDLKVPLSPKFQQPASITLSGKRANLLVHNSAVHHSDSSAQIYQTIGRIRIQLLAGKGRILGKNDCGWKIYPKVYQYIIQLWSLTLAVGLTTNDAGHEPQGMWDNIIWVCIPTTYHWPSNQQSPTITKASCAVLQLVIVCLLTCDLNKPNIWINHHLFKVHWGWFMTMDILLDILIFGWNE